ncbi:MAG TPA: gamma-glutamyl-gamma-aminobutyrate hydrolase family protein [Trebonia sp.]|nr:gamma-glutamyl-gamma-aminobutyrate hydrolase family protein [Trebonia sp.]
MNATPAGQPVIGIVARTVPVTFQGTGMIVSLTLQPHVDYVTAAGCLPLLLPLVPGAERLAGQLDGLLIPGGPDVSPARYGAAPHPRSRTGSPAAEAAELELIGAAVRARLPILGICRGMQLLNVHFGGTLHQHLPEVTGDDSHRPGEGYALGRLPLKLEPGSQVAAMYGDYPAETGCHHHQAVKEVGAGLAATAWAPDGTIEAVEAIGHPFAVGLQWEVGQIDDDRPYRALAAAARAGMAA